MSVTCEQPNETETAPGGRRSLIAMCALLLTGLTISACGHDSLVTGSVAPSAQVAATATPGDPRTAATQRQLAEWAKRHRRRPNSKKNAIGYAYLLRRSGQAEEAMGVLQQAIVKHPGDRDVAIAYGKAIADTGRTKNAIKVLKRAEAASQADWDYMSTMGAMYDQTGDHDTARGYYQKALALAPDEPRILSNLGLSYALTRDLTRAEETLRRAAAHPESDNRVRQNLALVLGLLGKFGEAEAVASKDLPPAQAAHNIAVVKRMLRQENTWEKIKADG